MGLGEPRGGVIYWRIGRIDRTAQDYSTREILVQMGKTFLELWLLHDNVKCH